MGWRWLPDVAAARDAARGAGWDHEIARPALHRGSVWERLVTASAWTEGLETPRNLLTDPLEWSARDVRWVSGHGGEIGRAFYRRADANPDDPLETLLAGRARHFDGAALEALSSRVHAAIDATRSAVPAGLRTIDAFYATQRMRKWLLRGLPAPQFDDLLPAYLEPAVVNALLNLADTTRGAALFDEALTKPSSLHGVRGRRLVEPARRHWSSAAYRLRRQPLDDRPALFATIGDAERRGAGATRRILGSRWWDDQKRQSEQHPWARRALWNAVAVDALDARLQQGFP